MKYIVWVSVGRCERKREVEVPKEWSEEQIEEYLNECIQELYESGYCKKEEETLK